MENTNEINAGANVMPSLERGVGGWGVRQGMLVRSLVFWQVCIRYKMDSASSSFLAERQWSMVRPSRTGALGTRRLGRPLSFYAL